MRPAAYRARSCILYSDRLAVSRANEAPPQTVELYSLPAGSRSSGCEPGGFGKMIGHAIGDARDAFLDEGHMEVDEQSQTLASQTQVRQKLLLVDRRNRS